MARHNNESMKSNYQQSSITGSAMLVKIWKINPGQNSIVNEVSALGIMKEDRRKL